MHHGSDIVIGVILLKSLSIFSKCETKAVALNCAS